MDSHVDRLLQRVRDRAGLPTAREAMARAVICALLAQPSAARHVSEIAAAASVSDEAADDILDRLVSAGAARRTEAGAHWFQPIRIAEGARPSSA